MSALAIVLTCLLALSTYAGAVTTSAILVFALPCVVLCLLVAFRFRSATLPALLTVGLLGLAVAEVVNVLSGTGYGPAARSSFLSAAGSGAVVVLAESATPALLLLPVAAMVAGASALGAAQEVRGPSLAAALMSLVALALVERRRRRPVGLPRELGGVLVPLLLAIGLGGLVVNVQNEHFRKEPYLPSPGSVRAEIHPFTKPSPTPSPTPVPTVTASPTPTPSASPQTQSNRSSTHVLRDLLVFLLVLLTPVLLWLLARARSVASWRRAERRLRQGAGKQVVTGAWVWAIGRRATLGDGFDRWQSPDVLLASGVLRDDPAWTELASVVSQAAFADASLTGELQRQAWSSAFVAWGQTRETSPWWRRAWADVRTARPSRRSG